MKDTLNKLYKYFAVGVLGIFIDNLAILFLEYIVHISPYIATLISAEVGNLNNFYFNDRWTFQDRTSGSFWNRILKYHASIIVGFIVSRVVLFPIFYNFFIFHIDKFMSTLLANNISILSFKKDKLEFIYNLSSKEHILENKYKNIVLSRNIEIVGKKILMKRYSYIWVLS